MKRTMRLIDAEPLEVILRSRCAQCSDDYGSLAGAISGCLKLLQAQPTISPPPNAPLTLEALREMDGEPVWIETTDVKNANRWAFVDVGCEVVRFFDTRCGVKCPVMGNLFRTYSKTWLAYRRKPEGGRNEN